MASEALDINGSIEGYVDDFKANRWGIRKGNGTLLSLDGNYRFSDNWGLNTWYSNNISRYDSSSFGDISNGTAIVTNKAWDAKIKYESHQLGLGVKGRVKQFDVGVNYTYVHDFGNERISSEFGAGDMPRTKYYQNTLKMFGEYFAGKKTKVRLEYLVTKYAMDDYSWQAASAYNSNTSAYLKPNQTTQIIGLTLTQSF